MAVNMTNDCNKEKVFRLILQKLGNRNIGELRDHLWFSKEDTPAGTKPTEMKIGDLILHAPAGDDALASLDVYVCTAASTFVKIAG